MGANLKDLQMDLDILKAQLVFKVAMKAQNDAMHVKDVSGMQAKIDASQKAIDNLTPKPS